MPAAVWEPRPGALSLLLDDLPKQLLRVVLVPGDQVLPRGDLRLGGLLVLALHGDGDLEVALGALELALAAAPLRLGPGDVDALLRQDRARPLLHLVDRAGDDRFRPAAGEIHPGPRAGCGRSGSQAGGQAGRQREHERPARRRSPLICDCHVVSSRRAFQRRQTVQLRDRPGVRPADRGQVCRPSANNSWARAVESWKSVWTTCAAAADAAICASPSSITLPEPFR